MMELRKPIHDAKHIYCIGIGGIHVSAVAKLLNLLGRHVSGSDGVSSECTDELKAMGMSVMIGAAAEHVPEETDLVVFSSAVPETHQERAEARRRNIPQMNSHVFLGEWLNEDRVVVIAGTHGKSTSTALMGLLLQAAGQDPTVVVGSRVPGFEHGNLRLGRGAYSVVEGDEFDAHVLAYQPYALLLTNIEWDHTDQFSDVESVIELFRQVVRNVHDDGCIVANADDPRVSALIGQERESLESRGIRVHTFGFGAHADVQALDMQMREEIVSWAYRDLSGSIQRCIQRIPGRMNVMNALGCLTMIQACGFSLATARETLHSFRGIWRRFEIMGETRGAIIVSDYAHHPTAVCATLDAAKALYPKRRLIVCFQPHHHHRTRSLFLDFISSFDRADVLVLAEIYDVAGRVDEEDRSVSSADLVRAILHHDADRSVSRTVLFAEDVGRARALCQQIIASGDVCIIMGAGDIYHIARELLQEI